MRRYHRIMERSNLCSLQLHYRKWRKNFRNGKSRKIITTDQSIWKMRIRSTLSFCVSSQIVLSCIDRDSLSQSGFKQFIGTWTWYRDQKCVEDALPVCTTCSKRSINERRIVGTERAPLQPDRVSNKELGFFGHSNGTKREYETKFCTTCVRRISTLDTIE